MIRRPINKKASPAQAKQKKEDRIMNPPRLEWQPDTSDWSVERKIEEIRRCKADPIYFLKTYGVIKHIKQGKIPFALFPFQEDIIRTTLEAENVIILKARQLGVSTLEAAFAAWLAIFFSDKEVLVIATKAETAKGFLEKAKLLYQYAPRWMKPKVAEWNKMTVMWDNGSRIRVSTTTADAGASFSLSLLIVDECALIGKPMYDIWTSAAPTMSTGGKAVLLSTPRGATGFFYETYQAALQNMEDRKNGKFDTGITNFIPIELPWTVHPEHDEAWFNKQCRTFNNDKKKIAQEHLCSFEMSGDKVIDPELLKWHRTDGRRRSPLQGPAMAAAVKQMVDGALPSICLAYGWDEPEQQDVVHQTLTRVLTNHLSIYLTPADLGGKGITAGVDVATGGGADFSAMAGYTTDLVNAFAFKEKMDAKAFALVVHAVSQYYGCTLAIERNMGTDVIYRLSEELGNELVLEGKDEKLGLNTTKAAVSRPLYIARLVAALTDISPKKRAVVNDFRIMQELENFIWKNGKAQAEHGQNDDLVLASALAIAMLTQAEIGPVNDMYMDGMYEIMTGQSPKRSADVISAFLKKPDDRPSKEQLAAMTVVISSNQKGSVFTSPEDEFGEEQGHAAAMFDVLNSDAHQKTREYMEQLQFFGVDDLGGNKPKRG